jgi:subtilisin family serine protease
VTADTTLKQEQSPAAQVAWGIRAVGADTSPFDGRGVTVSILDTGIAGNHAAFAGMELVEKDFTGCGNGDTNGHGTHCAGTIFGRNTAGMRIGVAPGTRKALIAKVLGDDGSGSDEISSAVKWSLENGANIITLPLGIDFPGYVNRLVTVDNFSPAIAATRGHEAYRLNVQLFERLAGFIHEAPLDHPCMIVVAVGNRSLLPIDPAFETGAGAQPAARGFISVGALGQRSSAGLKVAYFSLKGANVAAPGIDIVSAKRNGGLTVMSGTSMAAAHVAGVAALWAEKLKTLGQFNLANWTAQLLASCHTTGFATPFSCTDFGAGMVRAPQD